MRWSDNMRGSAKWGNLKVIKNYGGKLVRITLHPMHQSPSDQHSDPHPPPISYPGSSTRPAYERLPHARAQTPIGSTFGSTSTSHFLFRNLYAPCIRMQQVRVYVQLSLLSFIDCLGKPMLRPIECICFFR